MINAMVFLRDDILENVNAWGTFLFKQRKQFKTPQAKAGMIPEPDNKKGAFAPFANRTLLIIFIIHTCQKLPFSVQSQFQVAISTTKASAYALLLLSAGGNNPASLKLSSHSEP